MYRPQEVIAGASSFLRLARLSNAILPCLALIVGYEVSRGARIHWLVISLVVVTLLHSVVTVWNDIADEQADKHNGITRIATLRHQKLYRPMIMSLWIVAGIALVLLCFLPLLASVWMAAFLLASWLYNDRPLQASRRPMLSIVILAPAYSFIPFMMGVSLGVFSWAALALAIFWTLGRGSLSLLKDYKDAVGDAKAYKKTFLLVYGHTTTARLSFVLAAIGYVGCIAVVASLVEYAVWATITLAAVTIWLLWHRARVFKESQYKGLDKVFHDCVDYEIIFNVAVIAWLHTR